jgi:hypothetical protein
MILLEETNHSGVVVTAQTDRGEIAKIRNAIVGYGELEQYQVSAAPAIPATRS